MKKLIFTVFAAWLISLNPKEVWAVVEKNDIPSLTFDRSKEVPDFELVPKPTPTPPILGLFSQDKRSWSKSAYGEIIAKVAKKYNLDPQVIYAVIMTESEGNIYAFRYEPHIKDASFGLGQLLLSTARSMGFNGAPKELYQPEISIDLAGKYIRYLVDTFGKLTPAQIAKAYNSGSPWKRSVWGHLDRFSLYMEYKDGEGPSAKNLANLPKNTKTVAKSNNPTKAPVKKEIAMAEKITPTKKPVVTATPKPTKAASKGKISPTPKPAEPTIVKIALNK